MFKELVKFYFSYFSTKTYVVGTQKNHFNETVLLSSKNIHKFKDKWINKSSDTIFSLIFFFFYLSGRFVFLFDLILYVPSTIFQLYRDESSWVEPVLS